MHASHHQILVSSENTPSWTLTEVKTSLTLWQIFDTRRVISLAARVRCSTDWTLVTSVMSPIPLCMSPNSTKRLYTPIHRSQIVLPHPRAAPSDPPTIKQRAHNTSRMLSPLFKRPYSSTCNISTPLSKHRPVHVPCGQQVAALPFKLNVVQWWLHTCVHNPLTTPISLSCASICGQLMCPVCR